MPSPSSWSIRSASASSLGVFALVLALVAPFSTHAFAQRPVSASVKIPFAFEVEAAVLPAGDYVLDSSVPSSILIRSNDGKHIAVVPRIVDGEPVKKSEAKVIFVKRNGRYVLHGVWGVLGKCIVTPELGEQPVSEKDTTELPLTYQTISTAESIRVSESSR